MRTLVAHWGLSGGCLGVSEDSWWGGGTIVADGEEVEVEVVVAHNERATLRVGDVFLKVDADQTRTDVEVEAMALVPIPTPEVLWRNPPVLALAALSGTALGRLGEPSTASAAAWAAAGAAVRMLHDAPLPPWPGKRLDEMASRLDCECEWLVTNGVLPTDVVTRNRRLAETALRPWTPVFTHGDLQVDHVFVDGDEITGVIDWSDAGQGDALFDLAILTLGHEEHLGDVVAGYGTDVDLDVIRAWWSWRSLVAARWLIEHGFDPSVAGLRVRRAEIPTVTLHEPNSDECRSARVLARSTRWSTRSSRTRSRSRPAAWCCRSCNRAARRAARGRASG